MRKEQLVGTRLPQDRVRDLEAIENAEQSDRSTTVRKLLYKAIKDWKLEHYAPHVRRRQGKSVTGGERSQGVAVGNDGLRQQQESFSPI